METRHRFIAHRRDEWYPVCRSARLGRRPIEAMLFGVPIVVFRTASGVGFDCGATAAQALARLVQGRDLTCKVQGRDSFGRPLGVCQAEGHDINAALVSSGWALADGNAELATLEAAARSARQGLWSYLEGAPEAWRQR